MYVSGLASLRLQLNWAMQGRVGKSFSPACPPSRESQILCILHFVEQYIITWYLLSLVLEPAKKAIAMKKSLCEGFGSLDALNRSPKKAF